MIKTFAKTLSANDVGATGSHQAGILVPKTDTDLLSFFPPLTPTDFNPEAWIHCRDESGNRWDLRYIYYNGKIHGRGTRNEYRITHVVGYLKSVGARQGDRLIFSREGDGLYSISLSPSPDGLVEGGSGLVILRGWNRVC